MTDEQLNALVETLEAAANHPLNDHGPNEWLSEAASAIRQLMRERDEAREVMRQISMACDTYGEDLSFGDMKTVHRIQGAARAFLSKHPPEPS